MMRRRWILLLVGLPVYTLALMVLATVLMGLIVVQEWNSYGWSGFAGDLVGLMDDPEWWGYFGVPALVVVASQAVFLVPVLAKRPPRGERPQSLLVSLVVGGAIAAGLTVGLALAVVELIQTWLEDLLMGEAWMGGVILFILLGSWAFWSGLLLLFTRQIWADRVLGRLVGLLLAGTLLEVLVVVPIDIMVRRRTDCYCGTGTFFALCLAVVATLWLAGPGVVISISSRKHRLWRQTHCQGCGYAKGPSPGPACPECGFAWKGLES